MGKRGRSLILAVALGALPNVACQDKATSDAPAKMPKRSVPTKAIQLAPQQFADSKRGAQLERSRYYVRVRKQTLATGTLPKTDKTSTAPTAPKETMVMPAALTSWAARVFPNARPLSFPAFEGVMGRRSKNQKRTRWDPPRRRETPSLANPDAPLLLADKTLAATRVASVLASLCHYGARLGIAGSGQPRQAHQTTLVTYQGTNCRPGSVPQLALADNYDRGHGVALRVSRTGVSVFDPLAKNQQPSSLKLRWGQTHIYVCVEAGATVAQLVAAIDSIEGDSVSTVYLGTHWKLAKFLAGLRSRIETRGRTPSSRKPQFVEVTIGAPAVQGPRNQQKVARSTTSKGRQRGFAFCAERELLIEPRLKGGRLTVSFEIAPAGRIRNSTAVGFHKGIARCVAQIASWSRFAKQKGDKAMVRFSVTIAVRETGT